MHRWFSGRMLACHAGGPGSIPGRCKVFDSRLSDKISFEPRYSTADETLTSKTQAINVYIPKCPTKCSRSTQHFGPIFCRWVSVVQWLSRSPHTREVLGSKPSGNSSFICVLRFFWLPCKRLNRCVHRRKPQFTRVSIKTRSHEKRLIPLGFEPRTFRVLGGCDNHYTTESALKVVAKPLESFLVQYELEVTLYCGTFEQLCSEVLYSTIPIARILDTNSDSVVKTLILYMQSIRLHATHT